MKFLAHHSADDTAGLLLANWKLLASVTGVTAALSAAMALSTPNVYTADARLLIPQSQSMSTMLGAPASVLAQLGGGMNPLKNPNDLYVGMLRSRNVVDGVLAQESLGESKSRDELREKLASATKVSAGKDNMVLVEVTHIDPKKAAGLVSAYIDNLKRLTAEVGVTEAQARRKFLEDQLKEVRTSLRSAEDTLRGVQEKAGIVDITLDAQADIGTAAALQGRVAAKEAEIASMRQYSSESNPDLKRALSEMASLRSAAANLKQPNLSGLAGKGQDYVRALRDVKYQEALFEALSKQFELAKVDEAKQVSPVQVVDAPSVPDRKSGPKRSLMVALGTMLGLLGSLVTVGLRENRRRRAA